MRPFIHPLLIQVEALLPAMRGRAPDLDSEAAFPSHDVADLRAAGVIAAPLSPEMGGESFGIQADTAEETLHLFRLLGQGNMALGRLIEAHVNALRLVFRYGDETVREQAAGDARAGRLLGLWVTDPPAGSLHVSRDGTLSGAKQFCSGAGHVGRAVVTATDPDGKTRLVYALNGAGFTAGKLAGGLAGMRAATTGQVRYDDARGLIFGQPGDYLREPDFSCGAWRTSAVTVGGMEALMDQLRGQLMARGRGADPHQQARVGRALIVTETARLWIEAAARRAEQADEDPPGALAYVGLARLAIERAALDLIELVQRSLGAGAFLRSNPVERLCRDLGTYLRQPAPDMVLTEAAARALSA